MVQNSVGSTVLVSAIMAPPGTGRVFMQRVGRILLATVIVWVTLSYPCAARAQRTMRLRNLWTKPQVHVLFEGYTVSFTIKDINKALELLSETGDTTFGTTSRLDTAKEHFLELYRGTRQEYRNRLQPLMQRGVGPFLLTAGRAYIENTKHKKVTDIIVDIQPIIPGTDQVMILFYDPKTKSLLFSGMMQADMYKKDLGID
jgi:hypothetical protein